MIQSSTNSSNALRMTRSARRVAIGGALTVERLDRSAIALMDLGARERTLAAVWRHPPLFPRFRTFERPYYPSLPGWPARREAAFPGNLPLVERPDADRGL